MGGTSLRYVEQRPRRALAGMLECVWLAWDTRRVTSRTPERIVPDGCPELIVQLSDPFARRVGRRWRTQPRAFLAGTLSRPWLLRGGPRVETLGLRFRPGALTSVFSLSMADARDREVPLAELVGAGEAAALLRALRAASTRRRRFAIAQAWLLGWLSRAPARRAPILPAVALVLKTRGQARIDDVARALGWSQRRLQRGFTRDLGISAKLFARIVRLNAVLAKLDVGERARAVDLALDAGYFDQAHLLRDFRVLAGRAPRRARERDGELARHFTHPERLRALLRGD